MSTYKVDTVPWFSSTSLSQNTVNINHTKAHIMKQTPALTLRSPDNNNKQNKIIREIIDPHLAYMFLCHLEKIKRTGPM